MLLIILKNVQIFYFLSLFVFHRFWISVPLHEDRLGIPNHCFHANDATVSRRPCFRILLWREFPKSLCSIRKQPLPFIAQRATFSADFPESLTFWLLHIFPDIRRAITWRALAFRLDRYWIYSYSILQNKDVNRNMIGGFFFPPIYFLVVVEMFRGRTIYNRELIIWRDQCVSLSALVSQQYSA